MSLAPLFAYLVFVGRRYGHVFEELTVNHTVWHRHLNWPFYPLFDSLKLVNFRHGIHGPQAANIVATYLVNDAVMVLAIIGLAALCLIVWQRRDLWWLIPPVLINLIIIASDQPYGNTARGLGPQRNAPGPAVRRGESDQKRSGVECVCLAGSTLIAALFQIVFNVGLWLT